MNELTAKIEKLVQDKLDQKATFISREVIVNLVHEEVSNRIMVLVELLKKRQDLSSRLVEYKTQNEAFKSIKEESPTTIIPVSATDDNIKVLEQSLDGVEKLISAAYEKSKIIETSIV